MIEAGIFDLGGVVVRTYRPKLELISGSIELVRELKTRGVQTAALSNTVPLYVDILRGNDVFRDFNVEVLSCEVGLRKPDPRIYELTLARLGVEPPQAFFTDDNERNIRVAQDLGIEVILFESPVQLRRDLAGIGLVI